jgi:phage terminase large subunit GpA-like protein
MFHTVPGLWDKVDKRFALPGSLERWIAGVRFGLAWSNSPTELASHPVKVAIVDERSRMAGDIGGEGDPVRMVQARTKMYVGSKVGVFSSPGEEDLCPTYRWWLTGTRKRWCWRCPGCGGWLFPSLGIAKYEDGADYADIRSNSWIECPDCAHQIRDDDRESMDARYIPSTVDESGNLTLQPDLEVRNSVASYWATGFASLVTGIGYIMEHYARASRDGEPGDLQAVVNTQAGELWKHIGEGVPADAVRERQVAEIPAEDIQIVTVGVDVQADSLYYVVRGWCQHVTSYLLDHGRIMGDTGYDDVWIALARVVSEPFCGLPARMVLIDSGHNTATVYEQCRRRPTWHPARGHAQQTRPYHDSWVDETVTGRPVKRLRLWHHCNDTWKSWLYARILWPADKPGAWFVPDGIDDDYCAQVVNERHRIRRGKRDWYRTGNRDNHYLDGELLAAIAADIQGVRRLRIPVPPAPPPDAPKPPRQPAHNPYQRRSLGGM